MMRDVPLLSRRLLSSLVLASTLVMVGAAGTATGATPPPLPEEHLTVAKLPTATPHWIWVYDNAINNEIDMRLHLFDGDTYRRLGQIDMGYWPMAAISPDGKTTAAATTCGRWLMRATISSCCSGGKVRT